MDYSQMHVDVLETCYEWFGYSYPCDGDNQRYNPGEEEFNSEEL